MILESIKAASNVARQFVIQNSPSILTGIGVAGVVTTSLLTGKASIAASKRYEEIKDMDTKEQVKEIAPLYFPAVATGALTISCIIGANHVNLRRNAALAAAYAMSSDDLKVYKEKVEEKIGKKRATDVRDEIAADKIAKNPVNDDDIIHTGHGEQLCYDPKSGRYFKSDIEQIRHAQNDLNKELLQNLRMSLNDFYYGLGLPETDLGAIMGWNGASYDGMLDIDFTSQLNDKGEPCLVMDYQVGLLSGE